jgi:ferric-dicitrate binding protein FerR (iron transport regulator)
MPDSQYPLDIPDDPSVPPIPARELDPRRKLAARVLHEELAEVPDETWNAEGAWARLRPRLATSHPAPRTEPDRPSVSRFRTIRVATAAAVLLVVAGSLAVWRVRDPAVPNVAEHATPNGTRTTVTLGDGSRITLNAGSRLRTAPDFGRAARDVFLDGEAFFDVVPDPSKPFRVHAKGGVAHDLGTAFTVRAYPELSHLEVLVTSGRVSLRREGDAATDSVVLSERDLGRLAADGPPDVVTGVDVESYTAWTTGALVLRDVVLVSALPQLERWFDVEIVVHGAELARRRISTRIGRETLDQVLAAWAVALGIRYERVGRVITLFPARP